MLHSMHPKYVATPKDTVAALLKSGNRLGGGVPLRKTFVQKGSQTAPQPGPLASLVHNGDQRGLDTYLLLKAVASATPFNSHRSAAVWARALRHTGATADEQTVSRIWRRLESLGLVTRSKYGRLADITLLREDGSGEPYVIPADAGDPYLQVPVAYWLDEDRWCAKLKLPAKAMLLVALSLRPPFVLPVEKAPKWYGISADTAQRGLASLVQHDVLKVARTPKRAPLAPMGFTYDSRYTLQDAFFSKWGGSDDQ